MPGVSFRAPQRRAQLPIHIGLAQRGLSGLFLGNDDNIRAVGNATDVMPKKFSQQPLDPVAQDGLADLAGNGCSQTRRGGAFAPPKADENYEMFRVETSAALVARRIFGAPQNTIFSRPGETLRVFARSGAQGKPPFHN